jgi:adenylate kinase
VGKSTVLSAAVELLRKRSRAVQVRVFGSVMFEEAEKLGVRHRDEIRRLPVSAQRKLQVAAAQAIARENADLLFVDTHLFIRTEEGFWPGLPSEVLDALQPTNLVLIEALPAEIQSRRTRDAARRRDSVPKQELIRELEIARAMLAAAGVVSGAPLLTLVNREGHAEETARRLVTAVEGA